MLNWCIRSVNVNSAQAIIAALAVTVSVSANSQLRTATATATITNGFVIQITVTDGGSGYGWAPPVSIVGGGGAGAGAFASMSGGVVTDITVTNAGYGYTNIPQVVIGAPVDVPFSSSLILDLSFDGVVKDLGPDNFTVVTNGGGQFVMNRYLQPNSAFALNGVNQNIVLSYDPRLFTKEMTLSAWVNFQQFSGTIWRSGNGSSDGWRGYYLDFEGSTIGYRDVNGSAFDAQLNVSTSNFVTGSWYQLIVTRTTNSAALFVNGIKMVWQTNLTPYAIAQATPISLGANNADPSGFFSYSQITFDTVHIYNRALSDDEVLTLYTNEAPHFLPLLGISTVVRVNMQVSPGTTYQLQSSTDLITWIPDGPPFTATNTTVYQDFDIGYNQQYFRLVVGN